MVLTAAFGVLLARLTRQREVVLGTSIAQRSDPQTQRLIGFFVNMLVLRFELSESDRFGQLLERVRASWLKRSIMPTCHTSCLWNDFNRSATPVAILCSRWR